MDTRKLTIASLLLLTVFTASLFGKIGIIVNKDFYPSVKTAVDKYAGDLGTIEGKQVWLDTENFNDRNTVQELKDVLVDKFENDNLEGTILIGDLPIPIYNYEGDRFACDFYYMDMDGNWRGTSSYFNSHTDGNGDVEGEIWISRITASVLADYSGFPDEDEIVNAYFKRVQTRMYGQDPMPRKYVVAGQYWQWRGLESENIGDLGYEESMIDKYRSNRDTQSQNHACGDKYMAAIKEGREYAFVYVHSSPTSHALGINLRDLRDEDIKTRFYNSYACSNGDYERANMVGAYALTDEGLVCVGSAKTGSMIPGSFRYYNRPLGAGKNFGEAFLQWYNDRGVSNKYWHYGMTLQGVGNLYLKPYDPVSIKDKPAKLLTHQSLRKLRSKIQYQVPAREGLKSSQVRIELYDLKGSLIKTLVNEAQAPGTYSVQISEVFASGLFICKLDVDGVKTSIKIVNK